MEEARYSFNVKCLVQGFECCFTMREDQPGKASDLVDRSLQVVSYLVSKGAAPLKPVATAKSVPAAPAAVAGKQAGVKKGGESLDIPQCNYCGSNESVELITFEKEGHQRQAYKCQTCQKWLR